jgi:hypothetical protein
MASIALIDEALTDDSSKSSSQTFDDPDATRNLLNDTNCTLDTTLSKSQPTVPTSSRKQTVTQPKKTISEPNFKVPLPPQEQVPKRSSRSRENLSETQLLFKDEPMEIYDPIDIYLDMPKNSKRPDLNSTLFLMSDETQDSEMTSPEPMITDLSDTQMLFQSQSTTNNVSLFESQGSNASTLVPSQPLSQSNIQISPLNDTIALMSDSTDSRLEEASFSPIPDEQNDEIDEPLSSDQFSQAFHKVFDTKDIDTFPVNTEQAPKIQEKRSSPRTDLDTIEIERVTEEEAEALKMSYLSASSIFDQRVPEPIPPNQSNVLSLQQNPHSRDVLDSNKKPWEAIDESLACNRSSPEETPESRLRRVSGMKRNQKFRPPRTSNSVQLGGDNDMRKKSGRYWRPF